MHITWENNKHQCSLSVPKEFCFTENIKYLSSAPNECLFQIKDQRIYKAISIEQETPVIEISADRGHGIIIRFLGDTSPTPISIRIRDSVVSYVRDWFDLDTDLQPFYELANNDFLLKKAVDPFYGLRNMGIPDLFKALCWGIIGQQINLTFAYTLKRRFVESFGRSVECEGFRYWIFPTPQDIATLTVEDIAALRMTVKKLIQIRGIGPWTAHYVLMRCLRFHTAFPIDDVGLQNAIKYVLDRENKPTKDEILQLSSTWTGWEAYATFYLWRFLY